MINDNDNESDIRFFKFLNWESNMADAKSKNVINFPKALYSTVFGVVDYDQRSDFLNL